MKLAFTFVVDSRDKHYNFTPNFVKEAGAKGYETQTGSVKVWSPIRMILFSRNIMRNLSGLWLRILMIPTKYSL